MSATILPHSSRALTKTWGVREEAWSTVAIGHSVAPFGYSCRAHCSLSRTMIERTECKNQRSTIALFRVGHRLCKCLCRYLRWQSLPGYVTYSHMLQLLKQNFNLCAFKRHGCMVAPTDMIPKPLWRLQSPVLELQAASMVGLCWPSAKVHTAGAFRLAESAEEDHARKDHTDIGYRFQNIL